MNYRDPQLRRALAGEYALGTLAGRARRRFEKVLRNDAALQSEVAAWEHCLAGLRPLSPPIRPRPQVWVQIARAIGPLPQETVATKPAAAAPARQIQAPAPSTATVGKVVTAPPAANQNNFWRNWAALATAASIALVATLLLRTPTHTPPPVAQQAAPSYVALLQMPNSTMHWTVSIAPNSGRMSLAANGEAPPLEGKSLEPWWLSANGPVAVGLLPTKGTGAMTMPAGAASGNAPIKLAVSVEPTGGSPTGQPTGPVVLVTEAVATA